VDSAALAAVAVVLLIGIVLILASSVKIVQEYERAVIFRLGRSVGAKGPGVFFIFPVIDKIVKVNLQIIAAPVESQAVITKDNITSIVDAVAYFQVVDAEASVIRIQNWYQASQLVAQTTLRSIVGRHELDQLLTERERIDTELQEALDLQTETWGIKVHRVEIRDVQVPEQMQRATARQAEAERERRAKIIAAEGELQASQKLGEAARVISSSPGALQLRQLQTMVELSSERGTTIIFPIPVQLLDALNTIAGGTNVDPNATAAAMAAAIASNAPPTEAQPDVPPPPPAGG
jgi:regulator of protease activity HflC (stomatin/prohibitin superfamily)